MHASSIRNEYADAIGPLLDAAPKAVLAAIAVSLATCGGDRLGEAIVALVKEWDALHRNGIVPQPVAKKWLRIVRDAEEV